MFNKRTSSVSTVTGSSVVYGLDGFSFCNDKSKNGYLGIMRLEIGKPNDCLHRNLSSN